MWDMRLTIFRPSYAVLLSTLFALGTSCALCWSLAADEEEADPLPLRRVLLAPERVPQELELVRQGTLIQLTRADFEERIRQARQASEAIKTPPRLLAARYRARLEENALVGCSYWQVSNPTPLGGILPLPSFNLAVREIQVGKRPAILGDLDGKGLGLLVDSSNQMEVAIKWTARGEPTPGGLRFRLEIPSCALTLLLLDLPAGQTVLLTTETCLLSGPWPVDDLRAEDLALLAASPTVAFPTAVPWAALLPCGHPTPPRPAPGRSLWRLDCAGLTQVDFLIRQAPQPGQPAPLVLSRLQTRQSLAPDRVEADFDFNLEVLHGTISELRCDCDPALHPTSVLVRNNEIETWEWTPGAASNLPSHLRIRLPEPFQGSGLLLSIHCLSAVEAEKPWTSPGIQLVGAVPRGETLTLQIAPDLELEDWRPGRFDLLKAASDERGTQVLTLQSGLHQPAVEPSGSIAGGQLPRRPQMQIKVQGPEYQVRQLSWWQIGPQTQTLTVQLAYAVTQGLLFRLPVRIPQGWKVVYVDLSPAGLTHTDTVMSAENGQSTLLVDLQTPLRTGETAQLRLELRPAPEKQPSPQGVALAFPLVLVQGTRLWEGAFALSVDPIYQAQVQASVPAASPLLADEENRDGLRPSARARAVRLLLPPQWKTRPPDYYFPMRSQALEGTLQLRPRQPRVAARCSTEVILSPRQAALRVRLRLEPEVGNPDVIDLHITGSVARQWRWQSVDGSNAVQSLQRLEAVESLPYLLTLGSSSVLERASLIPAVAEQGSLWRLTLAQPLRGPLTLEATPRLATEQFPAELRSLLTRFGAAHALGALVLGVQGPQTETGTDPGRRWRVPLVRVFHAERMEGEVQIYLAGAEPASVEVHGMREAPVGSTTVGAWRSFRYSQNPVSLVLRSPARALDRSALPLADRAHLTTYVELEGRLLQHFLFQVANWRQRTLPVRLPAGAELLAVKVDQRWVPSPRRAATADGGLAVELPVPEGEFAHAFEIAYALPAPGRRFWARLDVPAPVLPLRTAAFRRTWCLPPGLVPLDEGKFVRLPRPRAEDALDRLRGASPLLVDTSLPFLASEERRTRQQHLLAEAEMRWHSQHRTVNEYSLGEALSFLLLETFQGQDALVVDAQALQEGGLRPHTPIRDRDSSGSLLGSGLVVLPGRVAPLLTTARQWQSWQAIGQRPAFVPDAVEEAVVAAAQHGQDSSGRFRDAAEWLQNQNMDRGRPQSSSPGDDMPSVLFEAVPFVARRPTWIEWEPIAGLEQEQTLEVVQEDMLTGSAWALTLTLLLAVWRARRLSPRWRYGLLLLWLGAGGAGLLWLPAALRDPVWLLLFCGGLVGTIWYLRSALKYAPASASQVARVAAALLAVVLAAGLSGQAAAPGPATVWLLPSPADTPRKPGDVLAPRQLLEQLRAMTQRATQRMPPALALGADYTGRVVNGRAEFTADLRVHSITDNSTSVVLPLGGVELREALLDGAAAYPVALAPPQTGYAIKLKGRGPHLVKLRFTVRLAGGSEDQELRFAIPELAQTHLSLTVPQGARYLHTVFGRGQVLTDSSGTHLIADLGRVPTLQVRWRQEETQAEAPTVLLKELYRWNLQGSASRLLGVLQYTVSKGAATSFLVSLPEQIEVRRVEASSVTGGGPAPRLKDWLVQDRGGQRHLQLDFQTPVTGSVQIFLELIPRLPPGPSVNLYLPTPQGVSFVQGFLAYRVQGGRAELANDYRGVTGIELDEFNDEWQTATLEDPQPTDRAFRFRRTVGGEPFLRLNLAGPAPLAQATQDQTWLIGPQQAEFRTTARLTASQGNFVLVEWDLAAGELWPELLAWQAGSLPTAFPAAIPWPALYLHGSKHPSGQGEVVVTHVSGPQVRHWSQTGSRLQVWLQRSVRETSLEATGWMPRHAEGLFTPFQLPCLQMTGVRPQRTFVRLLAGKGLTLRTPKLQGLWPLPDARSLAEDRSYVSNQETYRASFVVCPDSFAGDCRLLTLAEMHGHALTFSTTLDCQIRQGELRSLTVRLRNGPKQDVHLEAPRLLRRRVYRPDASTRLWALELEPGVIGRYQVKVTGTVPLGVSQEVVLPDITVDGVSVSERLVAVVGRDLSAEGGRGISRISEGGRGLESWPVAASRLRSQDGAVWRVGADDWKLRLRLAGAPAAVQGVQVLLNEQTAAVLDGRRWLHQATYWLYHEAGAEVRARLPEGALLLALTLDGKEITPLQAGPDPLWLPLTGGSGVHFVSLRWTCREDRERLEQPNLEQPRLLNVAPAPAGWTIFVPPGYRLVASTPEVAPTNAAGRDLRRAEAQLALSRLLTERGPEPANDRVNRQLLTAQERFYRYCRSTEYRLALPPALRGDGPEDKRLAIQLQQLQKANQQLAQARHLEKIQTQAESEARKELASLAKPRRPEEGGQTPEWQGSLVVDQGVPTYWRAEADEVTPNFRLAAVAVDETRHAAGLTGLLVVAVLLAWVISYFPKIVTILYTLWPEEVVLLGLLGWCWGHAQGIYILLILAGLGARLCYLGRWALALLNRPIPAAAAGSSKTSI
jgi:hypothetical protein